MLPKYTLMLLTLVLAGAALDCDEAQESTPPQSEAPAARPEAQPARPGEDGAVAPAAAVRAFGAALFPQITQADDNALIAPHNIHTTLLMVAAGAAGETLQEFQQVLHASTLDDAALGSFGDAYRTVNRFARDAQRGQNNDAREGAEREGDEAPPTLQLANAAWFEREFRVLDAYRTTLRQRFAAEPHLADFRTSPAAARARINRWVAERTAEHIEELLPDGVIDQQTRLVLVSAIYFKGTWANQFDKNRTRPQPFETLGGGRVETPMMQQTAKFGYAENEWLQMLELAYAGGDLRMVVLLPRQLADFKRLERELDGKLGEWLEQLTPTRVRVALPRFTFRDQMSLNDPLRTLGLRQAFTGAANFSRINGERDLFLSAVVHETYIEVNETGTEAAGATGAVIGRTSIDPDLKVFEATRPFVFVIHDRRSGMVLFMGRLAEPTERVES